ncbi:MAG TPA: hypothetical protein VEH30_00510 [Terriglobales bacterium]|nr:hypothetical protein [Terriglobales bacterium]
MLRVEMHDSSNAFIISLEGRFTGEGAEHVRTLVTRCHTEIRLVVDLTEVTFIDAVGEEVLSFLKRLGAEFVADTAYTLDVCERLHLPPARKRISMKKVSGGSDVQKHRAIPDSTRPHSSCISQRPSAQQE